MLSVMVFYCCAESCYAECRGALIPKIIKKGEETKPITKVGEEEKERSKRLMIFNNKFLEWNLDCPCVHDLFDSQLFS